MKKASGKKSGFSEGRSNTGPSRSSISDKKKKKGKDPDEKANKRLAKLQQARDDLADVFRDMGDKKRARQLEKGAPVSPYDNDEDDDIQESAFANDFQIIRKSIIGDGSEDFNADAAHRALLKTLFSMSMDLMPICEVALRRSKKEQAAYALIAMASQTKDLATELKMLGNVENQGEFIKGSIIQPLFTALLQNFLSQFMHLKNTIDTEVGGYSKLQPNVRNIKRQIDDILRSIGAFMDASRDNMGTNIQAYLAGDMSFMSTNNGSENKGGGGKKSRRGKRQEQ